MTDEPTLAETVAPPIGDADYERRLANRVERLRRLADSIESPELEELNRYPDPRRDPGFEPEQIDVARVRRLEAEVLGARSLASFSIDRPPPLLIDRLDPEGHTIVYGTGGSGKGVVCAHFIVQLTTAGQTVLIVDYEGHPSEWARRIGALGGRELLEHIFHVAPSSADWTGTRGAIWQHADELREIADLVGATYLFIDSIVPACGATDALKPEAPGQYATALALIGRPACSLAHVTKDESLLYPFGSVFWHNLARMTYSLAKQSAGEGSHRVILASRKSNNYAGLGKRVLTISWYHDLPRDLLEQSYSASIAELAAEFLVEGPLTAQQLTDRLNEGLADGDKPFKPDSIRAALRRGVKDGRLTVVGIGDGAKYALAGESVA
jgi:hypothetical protein